jgi:hypothetical protein
MERLKRFERFEQARAPWFQTFEPFKKSMDCLMPEES